MKRPVTICIMYLLLSLFILTSCTGGKVLRTEPSDEGNISGTFDVNYYSNQDYDALMYVAILDIDGDEHEISIYAPEYYIKTANNVKAEEAVSHSLEFIKNHREYIKYYIEKILTDEGDVIGYEIKPLYSPVTYGVTDVFDNRYLSMGDGKVKAIIDLKERVKSIFKQERSR